MSDLGDLAPQGAEADAGPVGAPGAEATPPDDGGQEQVEYVDIDSLGDKFVKVTIDGEETSVPVKELREGYMKGRDYTHKTQSLAEQRKELAAAEQLYRAMQANPGLTVQVLAERSGMTVQQFLNLSQQQQAAAAQEAQEPSYEDPLEASFRAHEQRVAALEQRLAQQAADQELASIIGGIQSKYQPTQADLQAAVEVAMRNNLPPSMLPVIYESLAFRKTQVQQQARQEAGQQQQMSEQQRQAAAAAAASSIAAGTGATGTTSQLPASDGRMTLQQAISAAMQGIPD